MLRVLDRLEEILISTLIAAATLLIFVAVVHRYASGVPVLFDLMSEVNLSWAQELCIYLFIWMAKFGAAYGVRTGIHVGVDVLVNRLPPARRKPVILFGLLAGALFTVVVGSLGAYLMCFRFLQVAWAFARTGHLPAHDHAHVDGVEPVEGIDPVEAAREGGPA